MIHIIGKTGRRSIRSIQHLLELFALTYRIMRYGFHRPPEGRALVRRIVAEQIYFTAVQALPLIIPIALVIGSAQIIQFAELSAQYDLGKTVVLLTVRELGPVVTAMIVILRSATAVTIEMGYMKVFHEMEAIQMAGLDPIRMICLPRLFGITTAMISLFIVFDLVSIFGGYALVWGVTYIPLGNFIVQIGKAISGSDIIVGLLKAIFFGATITVTSLYRGFDVRKQITEIPMATSRAAVESFLYCLLINIFLSIIFYL